MSRPLHVRQPSDNACMLDSEYIEYDGSMLRSVKDAMHDHSASYLSLHFPELTFGFSPGAGKPTDHVLTQRVRGGYRYADWRTT